MISYQKYADLYNKYEQLKKEKSYFEMYSNERNYIIEMINSIINSCNIPRINKYIQIEYRLNKLFNAIDYSKDISLQSIDKDREKYLSWIQICNRILESDIFFDIRQKYLEEFIKKRDFCTKYLRILDNQYILYEGIENLMKELDRI